jgi:arginyl-tRNA synthetase
VEFSIHREKDSLYSCSENDGLTQPKLVADRFIAAMPTHNPVTTAVTAAPNGFINITLSPNLLVNAITKIVSQGCVPPPVQKKSSSICRLLTLPRKCTSDIYARRSLATICRVLEFVGHEVLRVNHIGDWGTQFGMLITYLLAEYPDFLTNPPDISNLTKIYKELKKRFDEDP